MEWTCVCGRLVKYRLICDCGAHHRGDLCLGEWVRPTPTIEVAREGSGWWVRTWMVLAFLGLIFISGMAVGAVFMITQQGR